VAFSFPQLAFENLVDSCNRLRFGLGIACGSYKSRGELGHLFFVFWRGLLDERLLAQEFRKKPVSIGGPMPSFTWEIVPHRSRERCAAE